MKTSASIVASLISVSLANVLPPPPPVNGTNGTTFNDRLAKTFGNSTLLPRLEDQLDRFRNESLTDIRRKIYDELQRRVVANSSQPETERPLRDRDFLRFDLEDERARVETGRRLNNGTTSDRMAFSFSVDQYPTLKLQYFGRNLTQLSSFALMTSFLRLAEFNSTVSPFASKNSVDLALNAAQWSSLKRGFKSVVNADGLTTKSLQSSLVFPPDHPRFPGLNVTVQAMFSNGITISPDGAALAPNAFKYNLFIERFPFRMAGGSRLALFQALFHRDADVVRDASRANSTLVNIGGNQGQFAWDATVLADGVTGDVQLYGGSVDNDTHAVAPRQQQDGDDCGAKPRIAIFSLPRAQKIEWDPYVSATAEAMVAGDSTTLVDPPVQQNTTVTVISAPAPAASTSAASSTVTATGWSLALAACVAFLL